MTKHAPRNDNVIVLPDDAVERKRGIWIPPNSVEIPTRGAIVAVGPGYLLADGERGKMDLEVGMRVEFHLGGGEHIVHYGDSDEGHFVLKEIQILTIVEEEEAPEVLMPDTTDPAANAVDTDSPIVVAGVAAGA